MKGNLLIKQSTFAECRGGAKIFRGVQPFTSSFLVYAVRNYKTACSYNFS